MVTGIPSTTAPRNSGAVVFDSDKSLRIANNAGSYHHAFREQVITTQLEEIINEGKGVVVTTTGKLSVKNELIAICALEPDGWIDS